MRKFTPQTGFLKKGNQKIKIFYNRIVFLKMRKYFLRGKREKKGKNQKYTV